MLSPFLKLVLPSRFLGNPYFMTFKISIKGNFLV